MTRLFVFLILYATVTPAISTAQTTAEREPNDSRETANVISLGETIIARMQIPNDADYFSVDLQAGTNISIEWLGLQDVRDWEWIVEFRNDSGRAVVGTSGATGAYTDSSADSTASRRLWFTIRETGRYLVHFRGKRSWSGANPSGEYTYRMRLETFQAAHENESNNTAASANHIAFGDTISGVATWGDIDVFALDLSAGTNLVLDLATLKVGCNLAALLKLMSPDGTVLTEATAPPGGGEHNPRIEYPIASSGRYMVTLTPWVTSSAYGTPCYFLTSNTYVVPPPGPGEPVTAISSGPGDFISMAAGRTGSVFISSAACYVPERRSNNTIHRLESDGSKTVIADSLMLTGDIIVDGFGDILAPGFKPQYDGVVWRVSEDGDRSAFAEGLQRPCAVALAPDGDIWVLDAAENRLWRFDPLGNLKEQGPQLPPYISDRMAFSPSGVLHLSGNHDVWMLQGGQLARLDDATRRPWEWPIAFDEDGYIYVSRRRHYGYELDSKIVLLDPEGKVVADPVAWVNYPKALLFLRNPDGTRSNRILVQRTNLQLGVHEIVELNSAGIRAPGTAFGRRFVRAQLDSLSNGTWGIEYRDTVRVRGGNAEGSWSIINGRLPAGMTLQSSGVLSGTPADSGTFALTLRGDLGDSAAIARATISVTAPHVSIAQITDALLGFASLPDGGAEFLDDQGNKNGRFDVGDLRAYLRAQGLLP